MTNVVDRNHIQTVARAGPVLRAVAGAALAVLACVVQAGCSKGTQPRPAPTSLLYASMIAVQGVTPPAFIAVIDCANDSIIDTLTAHVPSFPWTIASPDGKYFAVHGSGPPYIFDAVTRSPIKALDVPGRPLFLPDAKILLSGGLDSTIVYNIPDFSVKEVWPQCLPYAERVPGRQLVATWHCAGNHVVQSTLIFFDYINGQVVDSVIIDPDEQGVGLSLGRFTFSSDGCRLYVLAGRHGVFFIGYDLRTRQVLFRQPAYTGLGYCRVTPDGKEVWVTEPDLSTDGIRGWPETIFIFDPFTGTLMDTVSLRGLSPNPYEPLAPQDIRFVPDGSKAYVNCGSVFKSPQPILVINARTRHIDRLLYGDFQHMALSIDVAPQL